MPQSAETAARRLPTWHFAARAGFGLLLLISSLYGVLAYMPDTYFAFIQAPFQQWLPQVIHLQPVLLLVLAILLGWSLWKLRVTAQDARIAILFLVTNTALAVWMVLVAPFSHLANDSRSFIWAIVILFPMVWLALADVRRDWRRAPWSAPSSGILRLWPAAALGVWVGLLIPGAAHVRYWLSGRPSSLGAADYGAWLLAVVTHVCFFVGLVSIINLVRALSARSRSVGAVRFVMFTFLAWLALWLLFAKVIEPPVPFAGVEAEVYAVAIALAAAAWGASLRMLWLRRSHAVSAAPDPRRRRMLVISVLLFSAAFALTVPAFIGLMDWNGILERLFAVLLWIILLAVLLPLWPSREEMSTARSAGWVVLAGALLAAGAWTQSHLAVSEGKSHIALRMILGRHAFVDPSFQVIAQVLAVGHTAPCDALCEFLNQQTNIPASMEVKAMDIGLVQELKPTPTPKPNIFIFVIDSLRQDYVSAYNPAVDFTPELGKFADDSVVMRNAFTRYAGTTLSEPSIWTGSMLLHKHFVQPFHPLNNLEKMLDVDGYRRFVTVDTTLRVLLRPSQNTVPLDENLKTWTDTDLCTTVQDFESKLEVQRNRTQPVFLYTQSQNIHIISISNHAARIHPQRSYGDFNALIATELQRFDGCFGGFVRYLKARGLYDDSVIVVTADHGEALNESGHRRHALAIHPEILRIPLIIHLPQKLRSNLYYDTSKVAFTIDVTPSLFYLLGHRPILNVPELGRPLFTNSKAEHDSYLRDDYLVVSSYGPVYGLLAQNGQRLFVDNEVEGTRQYFDLETDPWGKNNLITTELAAGNGNILRQRVQAIADEYHFQYRRPTLLDWALR